MLRNEGVSQLDSLAKKKGGLLQDLAFHAQTLDFLAQPHEFVMLG
jgi:hypothetical protein